MFQHILGRPLSRFRALCNSIDLGSKIIARKDEVGGNLALFRNISSGAGALGIKINILGEAVWSLGHRQLETSRRCCFADNPLPTAAEENFQVQQ